MFHKTRYYGSFPEIEEKFGVRIETHTEFDNENGEMYSDSVYYAVYDKDDKWLFDMEGDWANVEQCITDKLEGEKNYE